MEIVGELHEKIRQLSMQAGKTVKEEGKENNLVDLIAADPAFGLTKADIEKNLKLRALCGTCTTPGRSISA